MKGPYTLISSNGRRTGSPANEDSDEAIPDGAQLMTIVTCDDLAKALIIRSRLEAACIPSTLVTEALLGATSSSVGVQVCFRDWNNAHGVLASWFRQEVAESAAEPVVDKAKLPLPWPLALFSLLTTMLFCLAPILIVPMVRDFWTQGRRRQAWEFLGWHLAGLAFWVIAGVLLYRWERVRG